MVIVVILIANMNKPSSGPSPAPFPDSSPGPSSWKKYAGQNCYDGNGADSIPSPQGTQTFKQCQEACKASTNSCNAFVRQSNIPDTTLAPCFLLTNVKKIDGCCLPDAAYDTYVDTQKAVSEQAQCAGSPPAPSPQTPQPPPAPPPQTPEPPPPPPVEPTVRGAF